jgi:hypothetical protein
MPDAIIVFKTEATVEGMLLRLWHAKVKQQLESRYD